MAKGTYKYLQSSAEADYVPNLSTFADEGLNLIIAPGFLFDKSMTDVATNYPTRKFLIIDSVVAKPNVASAVFAEHEGSYLVGVAAALKAKADGKNILGFIGGMQFPLIEKIPGRFRAGRQGRRSLPQDPSSTTPAALPIPSIGQALAQKQFNAGAYIIFHAAGGTGNGMIKEAKERSQKGDIRWGIGVDKDQYADGMYGTKSAVPHLHDEARRRPRPYDVCKLTMDGKFPGGKTNVYSIANKGVGIPDKNPNLSAEIIAKVREFEAQIASGKLKVSEIPAK